MSNWQERIVQLFEKNTYSVVNIFDATLRPQLKLTGVVEVLSCFEFGKFTVAFLLCSISYIAFFLSDS